MRYWPLVVVGPFFVLIGVLLIIFRRQFSDFAKRSRRAQWGDSPMSGASSQTPAVEAFGGGGVFILAGITMTVKGLTS